MATADHARFESESPIDSSTGITTGELIDILGHERRRHVLVVLRRENRAMAISELAEWIVAREEGIGAQEVAASQRGLVAESLRQIHLPRLDAVDLLAFDSAEGIVRPTSATLG